MPVLPAVPSTMTPPGFRRPSLLGVLDDVERGAVLDRAAGIEELGLAEDRAAGLLGGAAQLDEGRVADRADKTVADVHRLTLCPGAAVECSGRDYPRAAEAAIPCGPKSAVNHTAGRAQTASGIWRRIARRADRPRSCRSRGRVVHLPTRAFVVLAVYKRPWRYCCRMPARSCSRTKRQHEFCCRCLPLQIHRP